ncbi:MAG: hypothetical protein CSB06_01575 [Bacteroidia bacterium]|nr:MAG: hypothetical protein CSB06_01575 [Bacteroidia bacterium]
MKRKFYILGTLFTAGALSLFFLFPKNNSDHEEHKATARMTAKEIFAKKFAEKKERKRKGYAKADKPDMFSRYFNEITTRIGEEKSGYGMNFQVEAYNKAWKQMRFLKRKKANLPWKSRGPANVGGRTRAIVIDPDDPTHKTWIVGATTGGVWKTTDGGESWTNLSSTFSNLSLSALAMAASDHNVLYLGTGESFPGSAQLPGNGIWKTTDKGNTWTQLDATVNEKFYYVNRLVVSPSDPNIVLAATQQGIFKTTDGGTTWREVYTGDYGIQSLVEDPSDFSILYATEYGRGVLKSTDAGETWNYSNTGLLPGRRHEIAVSPVDNNCVFLSVNISSKKSEVYFSDNKGANWSKFKSTLNFLGGQGDYDNVIEAHPYEAKQVFVGGVDLWKLNFNGNLTESAPLIKTADTVGTSSFLSFVKFGGEFLGGGMSIKDGKEIEASDYVSFEIRFGPGLKQKAHRFTVPDKATSGVKETDYTYRDYVEVPFQVWDTDNNRQMMVSFRDQEKDGDFNLYVRSDKDEEADNYGKLGREYIFVNAIPYSETPNTEITKSGGHLYKCLSMFWPVLTDGATWDPAALPTSKIRVTSGTFQLIEGGLPVSVADAYGQYDIYGGGNSYEQDKGFGNTSIPGLHPDHHCLKIIKTGADKFTIINGNDGGLAISEDNGATFKMLPNNYVTTQFYGAAKNPEADQYIGGMQDNGTWQSPPGVEASETSKYFFRLGGDGFECLWHAKDKNKVLGSLYNNDIFRSNNGGKKFYNSTGGIKKDDGPFITRLSVSKENPDLIFAVGAKGVYRSENFGLLWKMQEIGENWGNLSSSHNVEVSLANGSIVWAGKGMADGKLNLFVSTDEGKTFQASNNFDKMDMKAYVSAIATHPTEDSTAYALFSLAKSPKVLRTKDLGQTWEDISGFGTNEVSSNGFPDVIVHSLLVMPHNTNIIWVGTNIGIFESEDNGETWHLANNGLPPVSVFDMFISGKQIVLATHGRGIWTVDIPEIEEAPYLSDFVLFDDKETDTAAIHTEFKVAYDSVQVFNQGNYIKTLFQTTEDIDTIGLQVDKGQKNYAYVIAYKAGKACKSNTINLKFRKSTGISALLHPQNTKVYPNPCKETLHLKFSKNISGKIYLGLFDMQGKQVMTKEEANIRAGQESSIDLRRLSAGTYILMVKGNGIFESHKIFVR